VKRGSGGRVTGQVKGVGEGKSAGIAVGSGVTVSNNAPGIPPQAASITATHNRVSFWIIT
jgi:hypothetical protein